MDDNDDGAVRSDVPSRRTEDTGTVRDLLFFIALLASAWIVTGILAILLIALMQELGWSQTISISIPVTPQDER